MDVKRTQKRIPRTRRFPPFARFKGDDVMANFAHGN